MNEKMYVYDNTISARTYISYIAEQAGGFALIGRDGKLYIRTIGESTAELPLKYFQDYKWGEMFKVSRIRYEDGVQVFEKGDETNNTVYINQENMYISKQAQIDSIYDNLNNLEVYSFEGNSIIDPALDIGDILIIDGKKVLYQGSSQYGGKFKANISSKIQGKAKEVTTVRVPSQRVINRRVQSQIDEAEGKITQLVEETSEFDGKITKVEQTVDSITQKVESIEEFAREISSMQQLHLSDTAEGENLVLNLTVYGDTEKFKVLTPEEDLVPSEDLVPYGDTIDLIVDTQPRSNPSATAKTFEIAIGEPLRNVGQVRDELNIINNKVSIIRRISNDLQVLEQEVIEEIGEVKIPTYKDNTYIYIREYPTLEYFCRYIIDNDYIKQFASQDDLQQGMVELNTLIEQTNSEILLLARRKVGKDEVIASINLTPEEAKIIAKKIQLEGIVTANELFKILNDGSMNCVNAKFMGGKIDLYSATKYPSFTVWSEYNNLNRPYMSFNPDGIIVSVGNNTSSTIGMSVYESEDNSQLYVIGENGIGTWIHHDRINCMGDIHAFAYKYDSKVELKENIERFSNKALDIINKSDIYEFDYKNNSNARSIGLIIGEGYNTPKEVISEENSINSYSMNSLSWKAIQELDEKIEKIINILKKIPILGRIISKRWNNEKYIQDNIRNNRNRNDNNSRSSGN